MVQGQRPEMPGQVKLALVVLAGTVAIGVAATILNPPSADPRLPVWFAPIVLIMTTLVLGALFLAIALGRRWALVTSTILFILGLPVSLPFAIQRLETSPGGFIVFSAQTIGQAVAFGILLFMRQAKGWFAESRKLRAA